MTFFQRLIQLSPGETITTTVRGERVRVIVMMVSASSEHRETGAMFAAFQFLDHEDKKEKFLRATIVKGKASIIILSGDEEQRVAAQLPIFLLLYRAQLVTSHEDPVQIHEPLWAVNVHGTQRNLARIDTVSFGVNHRSKAAVFADAKLNPDGFTTLVFVEVISENPPLFCAMNDEECKEAYVRLVSAIEDDDETEEVSPDNKVFLH